MMHKWQVKEGSIKTQPRQLNATGQPGEISPTLWCINGHQWASMGINGHQWASMDICLAPEMEHPLSSTLQQANELGMVALAASGSNSVSAGQLKAIPGFETGEVLLQVRGCSRR
jgi:hypothetical protein